jgi:hypothetical protein
MNWDDIENWTDDDYDDYIDEVDDDLLHVTAGCGRPLCLAIAHALAEDDGHEHERTI